MPKEEINAITEPCENKNLSLKEIQKIADLITDLAQAALFWTMILGTAGIADWLQRRHRRYAALFTVPAGLAVMAAVFFWWPA